MNELYAVRPAQFYVIRITRPKYKLADGRIVTTPMPVMTHPHSNASESVLAHIATAKYHDHLPLNRQLEIFECKGVRLSASTVSNWMMAAARRLEPVYNELQELVRNSYYVMTDETPHPVLENDRPGILHLYCRVHVRRKFVEAEGNDPPRTKHALDEIEKLYEVERRIKSIPKNGWRMY